MSAKKTNSVQTSKKVARDAGRTLSKPSSSKLDKELAGGDLVNRKPSNRKK